jgi:hypothetical protein
MTEIEQLEQLIRAAEQMADDDPRLPQARGLVRLRTLAMLRQTYPNLDQANCTDVMATVFESKPDSPSPTPSGWVRCARMV